MVEENDWMEEADEGSSHVWQTSMRTQIKKMYIRCFVSLLVVVYTTLGKQLIIFIADGALDSRSSSHA